jgi:hypothetical protein
MNREDVLNRLTKNEKFSIDCKGVIIHKTIINILPVNRYKLMSGRYKPKQSYRIVFKDYRFGMIYFGSCNSTLKDCNIGNEIVCSLNVLEYGCVSAVYSAGIIFCSLVKDYVSIVTNMVGSVDSDSSDRVLGHEVRVIEPSRRRMAVG